MAVYAIGDIQGCASSLQQLLERIGFEPGQDRLWLTGDLVNRGPESLAALRSIKQLDEHVITVLGNHDLHLLAAWCGHVRPNVDDTIADILAAPDVDQLMHWLRKRPILHHDQTLGYLMTHAGIAPPWDLVTAKRCAAELEATLRGPNYSRFLREIYGNQPDQWAESLTGTDRLRYITNAFTRMRYCDAEGRLLLKYKGAVADCPPDHMPWFTVPNRRYRGPTIVFGHWSALGFLDTQGLLALDTGCVWGGQLTAVRLDGPRQRISIACPGHHESVR